VVTGAPFRDEPENHLAPSIHGCRDTQKVHLTRNHINAYLSLTQTARCNGRRQPGTASAVNLPSKDSRRSVRRRSAARKEMADRNDWDPPAAPDVMDVGDTAQLIYEFGTSFSRHAPATIDAVGVVLVSATKRPTRIRPAVASCRAQRLARRTIAGQAALELQKEQTHSARWKSPRHS